MEANEATCSNPATASAIFSDKGKSDITAEKPDKEDHMQSEAVGIKFTPIAIKTEYPLKVVHSTPFEQRPNREHCVIDRDVVTLFHPDDAFIGGKKKGRKLVLAQFDAVKIQKSENAEPVAAIYLYSAHDHHSRMSIAYCYNLESHCVESLHLKYVANLSDDERDRLWKMMNRAEVLDAAHKAHAEWRKHVKIIPEEVPKKKVVFKHEKTEGKSATKRKRDETPEKRVETTPNRLTRLSEIQQREHAAEEAKRAFEEQIAKIKAEIREELTQRTVELGTASERRVPYWNRTYMLFRASTKRRT
jgi:hypothetical protein